MGRATRWFKGLFGMKKERDQSSSSSSVPTGDKKLVFEKRRWSIGKSSKDSNLASRSSDPAWLRSYIADSEEEQSKHAVAVAAATAAAADAAVAAAQAAVAVVRLTSQGRAALFAGGASAGRDNRAAVKIQTVFRGFLARKALRALKGLVKLQALVRGYLVRKRAAATLQSMQALIRAQATVRSQRVSRYLNKENWVYPENRPRRSTERFDGGEFHSKRLSASYETLDDSPKIVEIDTVKPRTRSRRMNSVLVECGGIESDWPHHHHNHYEMYMSSPLPYPFPPRVSIPEFYYPVADECRFSTAQSTPRFGASLPRPPGTPAKSVCGDTFFRPNCPNYMSNTQSFRAKPRSHSAPKQRPEPGSGPRKRLSLNEIMAARNSISGVRMQQQQRSCSYLHDHDHDVLNY